MRQIWIFRYFHRSWEMWLIVNLKVILHFGVYRNILINTMIACHSDSIFNWIGSPGPVFRTHLNSAYLSLSISFVILLTLCLSESWARINESRDKVFNTFDGTWSTCVATTTNEHPGTLMNMIVLTIIIAINVDYS